MVAWSGKFLIDLSWPIVSYQMVYLVNWHGLVCRELLIAFRRKTNRRPERIIFYRYCVPDSCFWFIFSTLLSEVSWLITPIQGRCKWRSIQPCTSSWNGCHQKGMISSIVICLSNMVCFVICPCQWLCPFPFQGLCFFGGGISTSSHICGCPEKTSHKAFPWGSWKAWYDW